MKHGELKALLAQIAKKGKYVIFNELITPLPGGLVIDPADVPVEASIPVVYRAMPETAKPVMIHNYKAMVESLGYTVLHYHPHLPKFTDIYRVLMIAKTPGY